MKDSESKIGTWKEYFVNMNEEFNFLNLKSSIFFDASASDNSEKQTIRNMTKDNGDAIIIFMDHANKVQVIHSISNLGGSNRFPNDLLVGLSGFGEKAIAIKIHDEDITDLFKLKTPSFEDLKKVSSEKEVKESPVSSAKNSKLFECYSFMMIPPFLWRKISKLNSKKAESVFIEVLKSIIEFKEEISIDESNEEEDPLEMSEPLLKFLWAASMDKVPAVHVSLEPENKRIQKWSNTRHKECLLGECDDEKELMSVSVSSSSDKIQKLREEIEGMKRIQTTMASLRSSMDSSSKAFDKQLKSTQQLILNASSTNGEIAAAQPSEYCKEFFAAKSHGQALSFFTKTMKVSFGCNVDPPSGAILKIYNGQFLRDSPESPSNFSIFCFPKKTYLTRDPTSECIILQLKELNGKGLSNEDVLEALKQGIETPKSIEDLSFEVIHFIGAARYFFGVNSLLPLRLIDIHEHIDANRIDYECLLAEDNLFPTKVAAAIDSKVFKWLEECENKEERCLVNDNLIDFKILLDQIVSRQFFYNLPFSIRSVIQKKDDEDRKLSAGPSVKKQKVRVKAISPVEEENNGKIQGWLFDPMDFNKKLRGNKKLNCRPTWKNGKICHRFHSKGSCFENCKNRESHIPSSNLPDKAKKDYEEFLKLARGVE